MPTIDDATTRSLRTAVTESWTSEPSRVSSDRSGAPEPAPGDVIGRYTLLERLGAGGMGVVFAAHDDQLDRKVAIKVLRAAAPALGELSEGKARLLREAQAMAQLSHPHVVEVFDVGTDDGVLYIAMALVDGVTLRQWLRATHRSWREIVTMFAQAGQGLAAAHAAGLVHRDFKPANVLIDGQGHARVLDFGLAFAAGRRGRGDGERRQEHGAHHRRRPAAADDERGPNEEPDSGAGLASRSLVTNRLTAPLTVAGTVMGTPAYMAPEQHEGEAIGPAADQFAFCAALYEAIYGVRPFAGRSADELWRAKRVGQVTAPPRAHPAPAGLHRVLVRGLRPRPADRWPSMGVLLAALEIWGRPRPRGRWLAAGVGGLVLAAGVAAGVAAWPWLRPPQGDAACVEARTRLGKAWGEPQREALRAALQRGDAAYAADTVARVEHRLDGYAARWLDLHAQLCDTVPDDARARSVRERGLECLERRRRRMATLVEALTDARTALLLQAAGLVQGLPALEGCAAEVPDDGGLVLPDDPATALRVSEIHRALEEVQARVAAGQYDRAHELAQQLHARAEALGYGPLSILTETWLGETLIHRGERQAAEARLVHALHQAEAAGDDAQVVHVATRLVHLTGDRPEESLRWARHGQARLSRLPDDPHAQATMRESLGMALIHAGRAEEAVAELSVAIERWTALVGSDALQTAVARNNLGIAYYDLGRHAEAIAEYEQVLRIRERAQGAEHPDVGAVLNNLANAWSELGEHERALELQQRALAIWGGGLGPDHPNVGALYSNLGNSARALGRVTEALEAHERSIEIRERALGSEHPEVAVSRLNYGMVLGEVGRHDEALTELRHARSILERSLGDHPWTAAAIGAEGTTRLARGEPEAAVAAQEQALAMLEALGMLEHPMAVEVRRELGEARLAAGQVAEARAPLEQALALQEQRGGVSPELAAALWFSLAKVLRARGEEPARARALAERARATWEAGPASGRRKLAEVEAWLGQPDHGAP